VATPAADKMRRCRRRRRAGVVVLQIEVDPIAVTDWLINRGFLQPKSAVDDPAAIAAALSKAIAVWSRA